jgi:type VI secretion system protein ImpL
VEHGDETIYQSILQQAADKYPARTASSLLPEVDSRGLFLLPGTLPGAYTREAWDGHVRTAIEHADPKQGGEALWVMGAEAARSEGSLLKTRLQQRYFNDYAAAWQRWLNGLRWQSANNLSSTVEQLSTYADPQRSPLLALMSMIQYQGQAGAAENPWPVTCWTKPAHWWASPATRRPSRRQNLPTRWPVPLAPCCG